MFGLHLCSFRKFTCGEDFLENSNNLKLSYENYKEGVQINFSTGYIDPDDMMAGDSYPPINQQTQQNLYDEEAPYQDKEQLLRFEDGQE